MASKQSLANKTHYESMAANTEPMTPEAVIEVNDIHWTALTAEPRGVDYLEVDAAGVPAMWIVPKGSTTNRVLFYAHGGGFVSGSIYTHRKLVGHLAKAAGCRALIFDYPYAHEAKHPAQLEATMTAYRWLLWQGVAPERVVMAGDSCGAILVFGAVQRMRDERMATPAGIAIISGWLDLAATSPTFEQNAEKDIFFTRATNQWLASNFLGDTDARDPYVSALYCDPTGFPPIYLQAGADETLVGESVMFAERARDAGVNVQIDVFPEMLHSFQMMAGRAPEADEAIARLGAWARERFGLTTQSAISA